MHLPTCLCFAFLVPLATWCAIRQVGLIMYTFSEHGVFKTDKSWMKMNLRNWSNDLDVTVNLDCRWCHGLSSVCCNIHACVCRSIFPMESIYLLYLDDRLVDSRLTGTQSKVQFLSCHSILSDYVINISSSHLLSFQPSDLGSSHIATKVMWTGNGVNKLQSNVHFTVASVGIANVIAMSIHTSHRAQGLQSCGCSSFEDSSIDIWAATDKTLLQYDVF